MGSLMTSIYPQNIILYADDDKDDQLLIEEAFERYSSNVKIVLADNGTEALDYLNSLLPLDPAPCLIILDINMPRINGKEALVQIRNMERFANTPVILFTTSSQLQDKMFAAEYKAGFITKPIDGNQMRLIADLFIDHCNEDIKKIIRSGTMN